MITQAMRAILLASATAATLVGLRSIKRASHGRLAEYTRVAGAEGALQQPAQVAIALLGYAPETLLAAGRVLLRHQADPGRHMAT